MCKKKPKPNYRRRVLRLPDLDHSKMAVLNSLSSPGSRRVYEFARDPQRPATLKPCHISKHYPVLPLETK